LIIVSAAGGGGGADNSLTCSLVAVGVLTEKKNDII
jgi:hypothetical protein